MEKDLKKINPEFSMMLKIASSILKVRGGELNEDVGNPDVLRWQPGSPNPDCFYEMSDVQWSNHCAKFEDKDIFKK